MQIQLTSTTRETIPLIPLGILEQSDSPTKVHFYAVQLNEQRRQCTIFNSFISFKLKKLRLVSLLKSATNAAFRFNKFVFAFTVFCIDRVGLLFVDLEHGRKKRCDL